MGAKDGGGALDVGAAARATESGTRVVKYGYAAHRLLKLSVTAASSMQREL
jgi:hypothetical protein